MGDKAKLTYEQLFFLGELLEAEYIDYRYIAALSDIEQRYQFLRNSARAELVEKGLLDENFYGDITVKPWLRELLEPIFFGNEEFEVEVALTGEDADISVKLFHIKEKKVTLAKVKKNEVELQVSDMDEILKLVSTMIPDMDESLSEEFAAEKISQVIKLKKAKIGIGCSTQSFAVSNGIIYCQDEDGNAQAIKKEEFYKMAETLLKEE